MKEVNVTIVNCQSNFGENCQFSIQFDTMKNLTEQIDKIISEVNYASVSVSLEFDDVELSEAEMHFLDENNIEF